MNKISLVAFPEESYAAVTQMSQYINVSFAFVNDKYEEIMQRVRCKDFMNVPNWQRKHGDQLHGNRIYGWTYNFKKNPYDLNTTRISFAFSHQDQCNNFIRNIGYLNDIEEKYGIAPTQILLTQKAKVVVVEGDKAWQSNCWKMSMYMMYLRRLAHTDVLNPEPTSSDANFRSRLQSSKGTEHNLLTHIHGNDMDEVESEYEVGTAHSGSGVMYLTHYFDLSRQSKAGLSRLPENIRKIISFVATPNPDFKLKEAA